MKDSTVSARVETDVKMKQKTSCRSLEFLSLLSLIPCTARSFIVMAFRSH